VCTQHFLGGCYTYRDQSFHHVSIVLLSHICTCSQICEEPVSCGEDMDELEIETMKMHHGQAYNLATLRGGATSRYLA
jgi:hypothetical protein